MRLLGIDEAGRGCVIGPMILCGMLIKVKNPKTLKPQKEFESMGVKDSKKLTPKKRELLFPQLIDNAIIRKISPGEIDKKNLNLIEMEETVQIVKQSSPDILFVDVPTNPSGVNNYKTKLLSLLKKEGISIKKVYAQNKADETFPIVSAASIVAKVTRDRIIENLKKIYGDFGSGYPSDKKTVCFLRELKQKHEVLDIVRKKWKVKLCS